MNNSIKPVGLQLYTLREEAEKDFPAVLRRVANIGYKGVEPAGFFGFTPKEFRTFVEELGMQISSTHRPWALPGNLPEVIDGAGELGVKYVATGYKPGDFASLETIKVAAEVTARMNDELARAGLTLVVHNHAWEFDQVDGRIKYDIFAELCPDVKFELDTYWTANFGEHSSAEMMRKFAHRSPLLHIKDGPMIRPSIGNHAKTNGAGSGATESPSLLPLGRGKNEIEGVIAAMDPMVTEWLIVEQDTSDTDIFDCIEESYRYLTQRGLAVGNK